MSQIFLPPLPYAYDALEPHISSQTLTLHHTKHQAGYLDKLKAAIKGSDLETLDLLSIVRRTYQDAEKEGVFNNAAQCWNHTFYWESMAPNGGGKPNGLILDALVQSFGSFENFYDAFQTLGLGQFGSGWVWLIAKGQTLHVTKTANAFTPVVNTEEIPIFVCDVWEHAYYLEYQNRRAEYLKIFLDHLVDWNAATRRLQDATQ